MVNSQSKFALGQVVATSNALARISPDDVSIGIRRHAAGDWGEVDEEDCASNEKALTEGLRLMSIYTDPCGTTFWIVTEWDRSFTTVLLPEDY